MLRDRKLLCAPSSLMARYEFFLKRRRGHANASLALVENFCESLRSLKCKIVGDVDGALEVTSGVATAVAPLLSDGSAKHCALRPARRGCALLVADKPAHQQCYASPAHPVRARPADLTTQCCAMPA